MQINLIKGSHQSYSEQISGAIAERIRSGLLQEGEPLPSVRSFAQTLGVSLMTIQKAYAQLQQRDLINSVPGKGSFVRDNKKKQAAPLHDWQLMIPDYLPRAQTWKQMKDYPLYQVLDLSKGVLHDDFLPLGQLSKSAKSVVKSGQNMFTKYGDQFGDPHLRRILQMDFQKLGIYLELNQIMITTGTQQGIDLVARTFLGPGDRVVVESPTYMGAIDIFRARGATVIPVPVDDEGMCTNYLMKICDQYQPKLIYTIPTFQNPKGTVMSSRRKRELLDIAEGFHIMIVEDDPWSDIYFEQPPPKPIQALDSHGHVIYLKGYSKIVSPGCRIGTLTAKGTILSRLQAAKCIADLGSSIIPQRIMADYLDNNNSTLQFRKINTLLNKHLDLVTEVFSKQLPSTVNWTKPAGGLVMWLTLPKEINTDHLLHEALKKGVSFLPSSVCFPGEPEYHHLRISFGSLSLANLRIALIRLCETILQAIDSNHQLKNGNPFI